MRFLIDQQLPPALARWFTSEGHEAHHVAWLDLGQAADEVIWAEALRTNAVIVLKDVDFAMRRKLQLSGPQIVRVRFGNARTAPLIQKLEQALPLILEAL